MRVESAFLTVRLGEAVNEQSGEAALLFLCILVYFLVVLCG